MAAPTITSISKSTINPGQSLDLVGTNFGASGASLWLADADNFATANLVEFTVDSHNDTTMSATVTPGSFGDGTYYLFVENSSAETNASGEEVELVVSDLKLFFGNDRSDSGSFTTDYHWYSPFLSAYSGKILALKNYATASGNIKSSIHDSLGNLLLDPGEFAVASGQNIQWLATPLSVNATDEYRLGFNGNTSGVNKYGVGGSVYAYSKQKTYSTYTPEDPMDTGYNMYVSPLYLDIAAYGYALPTISSKDKTVIYPGQTLNLTGDDFMSSGAKLWLADADNFATATKVEQTVTSHTNTTLSANVVLTGVANGTHYLFVETDIGLVNATGEAIEVVNRSYFWIQRSDGSISAYPHEVVLV